MDYTFEIFTQSEMDYKVRNMKLEHDKFAQAKYAGFHYFSPDHVYRSTWHRPKDQPEDHFFLAFHKDEIIGVCLLQKSPYEEEKPVWWVSYIHIRQDFKLKGIARGLYRLINEWVEPSMVIYGGMLSDEGKSADLHGLRKSMITRCSCFGTSEEYWLSKQNQPIIS